MKDSRSLTAHPLADIFPMPKKSEIKSMAMDILGAGLRQPIVLLDGKVLDGRCRLAACHEVGIEPTFIDFDGGNAGRFVISANVHRRHLTAGQRSMAAADYILYESDSSARSTLPVGSVAMLFGASARSVYRALHVRRHEGDEVAKLVLSGEQTATVHSMLRSYASRNDGSVATPITGRRFSKRSKSSAFRKTVDSYAKENKCRTSILPPRSFGWLLPARLLLLPNFAA